MIATKRHLRLVEPSPSITPLDIEVASRRVEGLFPDMSPFLPSLALFLLVFGLFIFGR